MDTGMPVVRNTSASFWFWGRDMALVLLRPGQDVLLQGFQGQFSPLEVLRLPKVIAKLDRVSERVDQIHKLLSDERDPTAIAQLSKELSELEPVSAEFASFKDAQSGIAEVQVLLRDPSMRELAQEERGLLEQQLATSAQALMRHLLPKDVADEGSAVLEIRAGAGGSEAALFVRDLFNMYERYAGLLGWQWEEAAVSDADSGGFKDVSATISGQGVFRKLKFESGVHRVQRVPETESQGRIHTSTVTVAILPLPEQVDQMVDISSSDLRVDVYRASGAGGQHVNKTESAVRITHLPTGIVVAIQDERSQHKNRAKAMKILRAKLYTLERERAEASRRDARRLLIGTGDRSERIRTYNYPQGRVTDHRVGLTLHDLPGIVSGERLGSLLDELSIRAEVEELSHVLSSEK